MFEKILVCLDGSVTAEHILPYIAAESSCLRKLILLKVVDTGGVNIAFGVPGEAGGPVHTPAMDKRFRKELSEMPAYLEKMAGPLREKGVEVECVVLQGIPSQAIVDYATDSDISLVAIATHGHSGLRQVTMGSTAEYVLKHCGLPVLLVTPRK